MKKLLAIVLVAVLALMMAVPAFADTNDAYDQIFSERWIIHIPQLFLLLDRYAYAGVTVDGVVDCHEYGVEGNVIHEWVETIYMPTEGLTADEKAALEYDMLMNFSALDAEDFCTVTSYQLNNYLQIQISLTGLELKENIVKLADLGLADYGVDYLGIALTEQGLLEQGYVKDI